MTLYDIFSKAGIVLSICICKDNVRGKSLGYAYVNCKYYLDALSALDTFNFEIIFGRPIRVPREIQQKDSPVLAMFLLRICTRVLTVKRSMMRFLCMVIFCLVNLCVTGKDQKAMDMFILKTKVVQILQFQAWMVLCGMDKLYMYVRLKKNIKDRITNHSMCTNQVNKQHGGCILDQPLEYISVAPLTPIRLSKSGNDRISTRNENEMSISKSSVVSGNDCISEFQCWTCR